MNMKNISYEMKDDVILEQLQNNNEIYTCIEYLEHPQQLYNNFNSIHLITLFWKKYIYIFCGLLKSGISYFNTAKIYMIC